jgi:hypothetical protein
MTTAALARPAADEFSPYYAQYIDRVPQGNLLEVLSRQIAETSAFLSGIPESRAGHRYAPGKWSIRQIVGHLTDTERIMTYRALRIARGDATPLPGFDENAFVAGADFDRRTLADLSSEFQDVRRATISLFRGFGPDAGPLRGLANGVPVTPRALGYIVAGHELHHVEVVRTRYL